jgi:hypothetical protein
MHIPQFFQRPELACDMYGSSTNNSSNNTNGKTGVNIPIDRQTMPFMLNIYTMRISPAK